MRLQFLLSTVLAVSTTVGFCAPADFVGSSSSLALDRTTAIPGDTIKAGTYTISVTEQLADRMIVRIDSTTSKDHSIFLGVPSSTAKLGGGTGAVAWGVGVHKTQTIRGFVFPNGNAVEFVYPKAEAAGLAKDNSTPVIALDPRSEGKVALKSLSADELQIVNLWLLSMTTTGVDGKTPAVLAKHYDGSQNTQEPLVAKGYQPVYPITPGPLPARSAPPAPIQRAAVAPPATPSAPVARRVSPVTPKAPAPLTAPVVSAKTEPKAVIHQPAPATPRQVARLEEPTSQGAARTKTQTPVIAQLPHTASSLPMIWMAGLLSLLGAVFVHTGRIWMSKRVQE